MPCNIRSYLLFRDGGCGLRFLKVRTLTRDTVVFLCFWRVRVRVRLVVTWTTSRRRTLPSPSRCTAAWLLWRCYPCWRAQQTSARRSGSASPFSVLPGKNSPTLLFFSYTLFYFFLISGLCKRRCPKVRCHCFGLEFLCIKTTHAARLSFNFVPSHLCNPLF